MPTLEELRKRYQQKNQPAEGDIIKPIPSSELVRRECDVCRANNYFGNLPFEHRCPFAQADNDANCMFLHERIKKAVDAGYRDAALKIDVWCKVCGKLMPLAVAIHRPTHSRDCWVCGGGLCKWIFSCLGMQHAIPYQQLMSSRPISAPAPYPESPSGSALSSPEKNSEGNE